MRQLAVLVLLIAGLALVGCGLSSNPANINGNWNATPLSNGNPMTFEFGTTLHANGDGSITVSSFSFSTSSS
jgi:hypothetical protein